MPEMFRGAFVIFKSFMDPYFKETQSGNIESYYIDPPAKLILKRLIWIWAAVWVSFLLTFNGKEVIMLFFWIPLCTALIYFVYTWKRFGYSPVMYVLLHVAVLSAGYGLSRVVHYVLGVIINV